jgi:hypothetical protein
MASGDLTPLQLTAGAGFVQNQGITLNSAFSGNVVAYESVPLISTLLTAISLAATANISNSTIARVACYFNTFVAKTGAHVATHFAKSN